MPTVSRIELLKTHTHAGIAYPPGAVIALDGDLARWLVKTGVARQLVPPTPKPLSRNEEISE